MQSPRQVSLALDDIASLLEFSGASKFRVNAYRRGAEIVNTLGPELGPLVEQGTLRELEGIGPALAQQIDELWNTGESELLARLTRELPEGAAELVQVAGLTPRRIRLLSSTLGIRSVEELRNACRDGRVASVPGFGPKTQARLLEAAERWFERDSAKSEPLIFSQALALAELVRGRLARVLHVELTGALRRGEELVSELEFVVDGDLDAAFDELASLRQVLRIDRPARVAFLSGGVKLTLHATDAASLGTKLVVTTGNEAHVAAVNARAPGLVERPFASERELYATLGCSLVPPELRAGRDELELATHDDFSELVAPGDVLGMVHCHTTHSDGRATVLEMARAAHERGMKYITITDHSPSAHYARGVTLDRLKAQWDEIAEAEEQVPIRILRGTESDILADGRLDFPDDVLERFDLVIASIHARHRMDSAAMTARIISALSLPIFKIWGHALGRILNHREPFECDVPRVLDALAASRGAVELNADPHRLDLPPAWIPAARERGLPFVVSVDAHSTRGLDVLRYGVTMARRGALRKSEVLNTASADDFARRVRPV